MTTAPAPRPRRRSVLGAALAASPLALLATGTAPALAAGDADSGDSGSGDADPLPTFTPGEPWLDTDGKVIQAHGGQVVPSSDAQGPLYYWYGEDRSNGYGSSPGVHVYSSRDLYSWQDEGLALRALATAE